MYQKNCENELFKKQLEFSLITGLGTPLRIEAMFSRPRSISNAYCEAGTVQGVRWGYQNDCDENPVWT